MLAKNGQFWSGFPDWSATPFTCITWKLLAGQTIDTILPTPDSHAGRVWPARLVETRGEVNIDLFVFARPNVLSLDRGQGKSSLVPRPHFVCPPEKWVWSTAYSILVQVCRNAGTLFLSNLTLDVIDDCISHCVPTIY